MLGDFSLVAFAFSAGLGTFFAPCAYPLLPGYVSYYLGETVGGEGSDDSSDGGSDDESNHGPAHATDGGAGAVETAASDDTTSGSVPATRSAPATGGVGTGRLAATVAGCLAPVLARGRARRLVRAATVGLVVSVGFFLVYGVLGGITAALGSRVLGSVSVLELVVGVVLIVVGTATALGYDLPTPTVQLPERRRSAGGFLAFGVLYAAAAAGCTAPVFVGIGLQAVASGPTTAVTVFAAYAGGMSLLMVAVTVATALGRDALIGRMRGHTALVERGMGVLLAAAGVVQLYFFLFRFDGLRVLGLV